MNIYEDEQYEIKMDRITDRMAYLILVQHRNPCPLGKVRVQ